MIVCPYCGTNYEGAKCPSCGNAPAVPQQPVYQQAVYYQQPVVVTSQKNKWVAFVLCFLLGVLGIHRFYVGKVGSGVLYLLTGGVFGIGWLVDVITILCGSFRDSYGYPLVK